VSTLLTKGKMKERFGGVVVVENGGNEVKKNPQGAVSIGGKPVYQTEGRGGKERG